MSSDWCTIGTGDIISAAGIAGLAGVIGVMYIVIEDMLGRITNPQHNTERMKSEVRSILAGGVVVAVLLSFLTTFGGSIGTVFDNYNTSTSDYLNNMTNVINKASVLTAYMTDLAPYSYTQQESFIVKHGYARSNILVFLKQLVGDMNTILEALYNLWAIRQASIYFICFAIGASFKYLMPAGIILRFFPPTKKVGSTFLSISVGVIFFMPVAFYLSHKIIEGIMPIRNWDDMSNMGGLEDKIKIMLSKALIPFTVMTHPGAAFSYGLASVGEIALNAVAPGLGPVIHGGFVFYAKSIISIITIANYLAIKGNVDNVMDLGSSGLKELTDFSIKEHLKTILFFLLSVLSTFVSIRSISLLLGGEFFLYGIQERI
ncbi:MAG: hypothetical protein QXI89_00040 [Candidatus Anstonellales archaeon]